MNISKNGLRLAAVGAATTVALGFFSAGAANADTFTALPDGEVTKTLVDGTVVKITRTGESVNVSPSMGATPLHRNSWVSGRIGAEVTGPNAKGGSINVGYVVACQATLGAKGGADTGIGSNWEGDKTTQSAKSSTTVTVGPGQAANFRILDIEKADAYGAESHSGSHSFKGTSGSVTYADSTMSVNGCTGYAQARSFATVTVNTDTVTSTTTLWGQPFSIG